MKIHSDGTKEVRFYKQNEEDKEGYMIMKPPE
jgi:hypothetical protein